MSYTLTDTLVRRVLLILRAHGHKSLEEVATQYNQLYPPSMISKVIGLKVEPARIALVLRFLLEYKEEGEPKPLVKVELLSFTDRPLRRQTKHYVLTEEGKALVPLKKR